MGQREVQAVDLRRRIEPVPPALVAAEFDRDGHVPGRVRGPGAHLDTRPHAHAAQLGQPRPVTVGREPRLRVAGEVGFQLLSPLVQPGRGHQALLPGRRVLPDEEGGLPQPPEQFVPAPGAQRGDLQRGHHQVQVGVVLGHVQRRRVQAVVARQDDLEHLGHHVRLGQLQGVQERPGRGGARHRAAHRGQAAAGRAGQVHGRAPAVAERRDLAAVLEPDDRLGPRRRPQRRVPVQERVQPRDPLIWLGGQELCRQPLDDALGRDLRQARLVPQEAPQHGGAGLADGLLGEPGGRARPVQRAQLDGVQQPGPSVAGQPELPGRTVTAAGRRDELLGGQHRADRLEQRPEHVLGREARRLQRQRRQRGHRQQPGRTQLPHHVGQQRGRLAHQGLVRRVVRGHVVPGRRGPVRPLHDEAEKRLLLGREEHAQRRTVQPEHPARLGPHRDLHPQRPLAAGRLRVPGRRCAEAFDAAVPHQPLLRPGPALGHRDAAAGLAAGLGPALDDRDGHPGAAHPQPGDAGQEQQDARLERGQRRGDLADRDRCGHVVVIEGEHEQGPGPGPGIGHVGPDVILDPEVLVPAVDVRAAGVGVDRLESDAELADRGEVAGFAALADPADAADVGFGERPSVVPQLQPVRRQLEGQLGGPGVLGVLDQLEDEVSPLAVQLPEQIQHGGVPAVPGDVLLADLLVVGWHRRSPAAPRRVPFAT